MDLKKILPSNIFDVIERAGISTEKQIIILSVWDIKKLTSLRTDDIVLLKNTVAENLAPQSVTCDLLTLSVKVTTGCEEIDKMLDGGYKKGTITEIYGESGSGKTQLTFQAAAHNWFNGTVFICTEDVFQVKRFDQVKKSITDYNPNEDYGKNVFVEHVTEACDLSSCVRVRLPKLLEKNKLSLIVIDSIAGPFRSEYTNYVQRAEELREVAIKLLTLAQHFQVAVLCINQVTASFDSTNNLSPSLGLAWSNMISTRLWLRKTERTINMRNLPSEIKSEMPCSEQSLTIRELSVIFAPDLPKSAVKIVITSTGIKCL